MDLKEFRKKYKLTQQRFADMLGISRSTYKDIESGRMAPPTTILSALPKVQEELERSTSAIYRQEVTITMYNEEGKVLRRNSLSCELGGKEQQLYNALFGEDEEKNKERKNMILEFVEKEII